MSDGYEPRPLRGHAQCSPFPPAQPTLLSTPHEMQTHSAVLYVFCDDQLHTDDDNKRPYYTCSVEAEHTVTDPCPS
ncbi:hypothetical protein GALMADRAFT_256273 [Galerina marginata CBS 339.88]|uniref:Uncharacterized protein n=1 Tax=Galerina marginata (strain CBS 339.88) TaxID=685588 RepID=A0A067SDN7_GALM3|nr:hypothetical protein GALMADRAFT_256273 [Galerina marginata CBS 339.88]